MQKVLLCLNNNQNGLFQSPTGTGKTLSLLSASLAWLDTKRKENFEQYKDFKIFYCSRTHSQLKQILKEVQKSCYQPKTIILASREKYCVNQTLKIHYQTQTIRQDLDKVCKSAIQPNSHNKCSYFQNNQNYEILNQDLEDIEDLVERGENEHFCPYYYSKESILHKDLILAPYGYLLNKTIQNSILKQVKKGLIIFDEAHNIPKIAEEGFSYEINNQNIQQGLQQLTIIEQLDQLSEQSLGLISLLKDILEQIGMQLDYQEQVLFKNRNNLQAQSGQVVFEGKDGFQEQFLSEILGEFWKEIHNFPNLIERGEILVESLQEQLSENKLGGFFYFLKGVYHVYLDFEKNKRICKTYRLCVNSQPDQQFRSFKYQCLDGSLAFKNIQSKGQFNFILASGTLKPFESWSIDLGIDFEHQLESEHVIDSKTQVLCGLLQDNVVNFSHQNRQDKFIYEENIIKVGKILLKSFEYIPKGVLVVFASHNLLKDCIDKWNQNGLSEELKKYKEIHVEKSVTDINEIFHLYKQSIDIKEKGAALFIVARGRLVEGIDFTDDYARGVIMVGVPNMPPCAYLDMKVQFLKQNQLINPEQWILNETQRVINQSIGRVIRHLQDYGVVLMIDTRFEKYSEQFPKWFQSSQFFYETDAIQTKFNKFFNSILDKNSNKTENSFLIQEKFLQDLQVFPTIDSSQKTNNQNPKQENNKIQQNQGKEQDLFPAIQNKQNYSKISVQNQWEIQNKKSQEIKNPIPTTKNNIVQLQEQFPGLKSDEFFEIPSNKKKEKEKQQVQKETDKEQQNSKKQNNKKNKIQLNQFDLGFK